ncbi:tRNA-guanine transglycosylase DpdA [Scytonema sp. NUACC26]|uniref:tRNA-guanine transglycosylase DpdA n=1 Tax=Scytonema sp. NUACC26 TaxID=3140176 RepID=UPI0038B32E97
MTEVSQSTDAFIPNETRQDPRVLVVTSCTGEKRYKPLNQLTLEDFENQHKLREREKTLSEFACRASQMYTGQQHLRIMEGVNLLRSCFGEKAVDLKILSAGYGLIPEDKTIVPYSVTFNEMKEREIDRWAQVLGVHEDFEQAISKYDLVFVLLGEKYLRALDFPVKTESEQTLIFLASNQSSSCIRFLNINTKYFILTLSNAEASRFGYGLVGLKGYLLKLFATEAVDKLDLLYQVYQTPELFLQIVDKQPQQLELPIEILVKNNQKKKTKLLENKPIFLENFSKILELPAARNKNLEMYYFIPEWEDRVDKGYDFKTDSYTPNRIAYNDDIYAHEIYDEPNYHGILVSKVVIDKRKRKKADVEKAGGIHNFIKFSGKVMGDCGAFGYIKEEEPPYTTEEIIEYYQNLGFNYGVSIDHLIVGAFTQPGIREKRYELTLRNAWDFLEKHKKFGCTFTPIGVAQGWNPETYSKAVRELLDMGYDYIGLGGLARAKSAEILEILQAVSSHLTPKTSLHLFGVGRIDDVPYFHHLGVTTFDSASPLRRAWLDSKSNYHTLDGKSYAAVRIPFVNKPSVRIKHLLETGHDRNVLLSLEEESLNALREFDAGKRSVEDTLKSLLAYDELLELPRDGKVAPKAKAKRQKLHEVMYRELLEDKPWKQCNCVVCQKIGVEVVIFRGNDRNRRRGFHNTYVFYQRFQDFLKSEQPERVE